MADYVGLNRAFGGFSPTDVRISDDIGNLFLSEEVYVCQVASIIESDLCVVIMRC